MPEVPNNIDMTIGKLGLSDTEENQIVAFLQTLSDGFTRPYPDINTFTGMCTTCNPATDPNCSSSRQGNNFLIRSEEHTSELQSRFDLVCRLLLEKKKK